MQPCLFVTDGIMYLLEILDQFVSEMYSYPVPDNSCEFASNKKDGGVRMAVNYREVKMQLELIANRLPYQPSSFQCLGS